MMETILSQESHWEGDNEIEVKLVEWFMKTQWWTFAHSDNKTLLIIKIKTKISQETNIW